MAKANLDELTRESRNFYERALLKFSGSLFFAAVAFMFIGFAAQAGGMSRAYHKANSVGGMAVELIDFGSGISQLKDADTASAAGYGFACFVYLLGFILASVMSWYMSPYYGTKQEATMLKTPTDLDGQAAVAGVPHAMPVPEPQARGGSLYDGYPKSEN